MTDSLVLDRVVKRFGDTLAVDRLDFRVGNGEVFGFLGGNDRSPGGIVARAIEQRFAIKHGRETMVALSRLVRRERRERADPAATWATHNRWYATPT